MQEVKDAGGLGPAFDWGKTSRIGGIFKIDYNQNYNLIGSNGLSGTGKVTQTIESVAARTGLTDYMKLKRVRFVLTYATSTNTGFTNVECLFRYFKTTGGNPAFSISHTYASQQLISFNKQIHFDFLIAYAPHETDAYTLVCDTSVYGGNASPASITSTVYYLNLPLFVEDGFAASPSSVVPVTPYTNISEVPFSGNFFVWSERGSVEDPEFSTDIKDGFYGWDQVSRNGTNSPSFNGLVYTHHFDKNNILDISQKENPAVLLSQPDGTVDIRFADDETITVLDDTNKKSLLFGGSNCSYFFSSNQAAANKWDLVQLTKNKLVEGFYHIETSPVGVPGNVTSSGQYGFPYGGLWHGVVDDGDPAHYTVNVFCNDFADFVNREMIIGGLTSSGITSFWDSIQVEPFGYTTIPEIQNCGYMYVGFGPIDPHSLESKTSLILSTIRYDYDDPAIPFVNSSDWATALQDLAGAKTNYLPKYRDRFTEKALLAYSGIGPFIPCRFSYQRWHLLRGMQIIAEDAAATNTTIIDQVEHALHAVNVYADDGNIPVNVVDSVIGLADQAAGATNYDSWTGVLTSGLAGLTSVNGVLLALQIYRQLLAFRNNRYGNLPADHNVKRSVTTKQRLANFLYNYKKGIPHF